MLLPEIETRLQRLRNGCHAHLAASAANHITHGRRLDLVSIRQDKGEGAAEEACAPRRKPPRKRKIVVIGARVHPGETPSSYVCQGMMNFLISDDPVARTLRENVTFKVIPMLNPDGVYVGNYRTCILGQDLNRCWHESSPHAYPTLAAVKNLVEKLSAQKEEEIDMYLDLHAHTGLLGSFVYGNSYTDVYRFQRHTLFPKHLSYCADDFSIQKTVYNKDRGKSGTSRRFLSSFLNDKVNCYTLEVSFHGYETQKTNGKVINVYDEEEYLRLGESICHSLLDYYIAIRYVVPEDLPLSIRETFCKGKRLHATLPPKPPRSPLRLPPKPLPGKAPKAAAAKPKGDPAKKELSKQA